jgi:hypothetical protein
MDPRGAILRGFSHARTEVNTVGYRKVSYLEQVWYVLRYKLRELMRKEGSRAK